MKTLRYKIKYFTKYCFEISLNMDYLETYTYSRITYIIIRTLNLESNYSKSYIDAHRLHVNFSLSIYFHHRLEVNSI